MLTLKSIEEEAAACRAAWAMTSGILSDAVNKR